MGSSGRRRVDVVGIHTYLGRMEGYDWLTTAEAAARIGVTRQTIARWIREGKLPARRIQVGQRAIYRIDRRDLVAFVKQYVADL